MARFGRVWLGIVRLGSVWQVWKEARDAVGEGPAGARVRQRGTRSKVQSATPRVKKNGLTCGGTHASREVTTIEEEVTSQNT